MAEKLVITQNIVDAETQMPFLLLHNGNGQLVIVEDTCTTDDLQILDRINVDLHKPFKINSKFLASVEPKRPLMMENLPTKLLEALRRFLFKGVPGIVELKDASETTLHFLKSLHKTILPSEKDLIITKWDAFFPALSQCHSPRIFLWFEGESKKMDTIMSILPRMKPGSYQKYPHLPKYLRYHCEVGTFQKALIIKCKRMSGWSALQSKQTPLLSAQHILSILYTPVSGEITSAYRQGEVNTFLKSNYKIPQELCDTIYSHIAADEILN